MTIKQKQCLLAYLGYYAGVIDGVWGDMSRAASEAFQRDYQLTVDGIFGVSNSQHLYGLAADLHSEAAPAKMKAVAEEVLGHTGGIGLYGWGIHVDTRAGYARWNG